MDIINGFVDSISLCKILYIFFKDNKIRSKYFKMGCSLLLFYFLNFINIYASKLSTNYFVLYILSSLMFNLLIFIPLYLLTFFLSIDVTNTINRRFIDKHLTEKKTNIKQISKISTEIHICIILLFYIWIINLFAFIPKIGKLIFCFLTMMQYMYYCFDYVLSYHNIHHIKKMNIISNNLLYFCGYGFIFGLIQFKCSFVVAHILTNLLIPIYVIKSYFVATKLLKREQTEHDARVFSIFIVPYHLANFLIKQCLNTVVKKYKT
jgi:hypothetical protein